MVLYITKENIQKKIKEALKPVIIDAYADWCGPCKKMEPIFEALAEELNEQYIFAKLNIDDLAEIAIEYEIISIPTFIFLKNNVLVARETGYMSEETMRQKISKYLS